VLNGTTLYLRIPSFDIEEKYAIDKVLADNKDKILKTENLIIDLRNNGGGSDVSFQELLPFLYTNPVTVAPAEILSTELNNKFFKKFSTDKNLDKDDRQFVKMICNKLRQAKPGEFVIMDNDPIISVLDTVYEYPKKVCIIINNNCASSTEQFLLLAKQSKKVKLYGTNTFGALDIGNVNSVQSPCKEFELEYGTSRSMLISGMSVDHFSLIDDIGIQPDYYLDKIPQNKWVESVNERLNQ
jgi:C-terminal processing protease CtpA/Prc